MQIALILSDAQAVAFAENRDAIVARLRELTGDPIFNIGDPVNVNDKQARSPLGIDLILDVERGLVIRPRLKPEELVSEHFATSFEGYAARVGLGPLIADDVVARHFLDSLAWYVDEGDAARPGRPGELRWTPLTDEPGYPMRLYRAGRDGHDCGRFWTECRLASA